MGTPAGVLLVNLGSPESPEPRQVARFLREFLMDGQVLDINPVGRWLLVNLIIAPFRSPRSAEAYRKIWTEAGSPLIVESMRAAEALAARFEDDEYVVQLAMRYGQPSIDAALDALENAGCERVILVPLYPQEAGSSSGTVVDAVKRGLAARRVRPALSIAPPFFDDAGFISAFAAVGRPVLEELQPDHVLFSFHGIPERHVRNADPSGAHCLASASCCAELGDANRHCYRAQCFATARALARELGLETDWEVCFQSRLGRDPWIKPYTDEALIAAAGRGVKRMAVFCPAFVADCLETLEEIGLRARDDFRAAGGEDLRLVPSLNATRPWIDALEAIVRRADAGTSPAVS